jgi:hypothetical protein
MKIKLKMSFGGARRGEVVDWADGMARVLVSRGVAELVTEKVERAVAVERAETATVTPEGTKRKAKR